MKIKICSHCLVIVLLLFLSCSQNHDLRFAWLSDTHLSETTTGEPDLLAAVQDINSMAGIDFVLVTGDITDINIGNNLKRAKSVLDQLDVPCFTIPGNHDTKWTDSGNGNFIDLFGDDKFAFEKQGLLFIGMHQGPELRMADGHFAPHDLRWLDSLLTSLPDPGQPIIFVTHYPIDPEIDNYDVFLDIIKDYNFRMVLHGHGHRNRISDYYGIPGVMGRSSLRARAERGGFTLAEVQGDSIFFREKTTGGAQGPVWGRLPLLEPRYVVDEKRIARPDFSVNDSFPQVKPQWVFESQNLMAASPVVADNLVFIGDAAGNFYALDLRTGRPLWQIRTGHKIYATAAAANGRVVFTCADGYIHCLEAESGSEQWRFDSGRPNVAVPVIEDKTVYVGGSDSSFRAIDLDAGSLIWSFDSLKGYVENKPLLYRKLVIFSAWDQTVYAVNKKDGSLVWKWAAGRPHMLYSPAACWPVAANGRIFIVAPDRFMTAIDAANGQTIWRSNRYKVRESIGISGDGHYVFGECMRDTVFAADTRAGSFKTRWVKNFAYGYDIAPSMLMAGEGTVYFGTKNGLIIAFEATSGQLKWKHKFGNTLINTVIPLNNKRLLFSSMDGQVVLLKEEF